MTTDVEKDAERKRAKRVSMYFLDKDGKVLDDWSPKTQMLRFGDGENEGVDCYTFNLKNVSKEISQRATLFGYATLLRNAGNSHVARESGNNWFEGAGSRGDALENGEWSTRASTDGVRTTDLVVALARLKKIDENDAEAMRSLAAKIKEKGPDWQRTVRKRDDVKYQIDQIKLERLQARMAQEQPKASEALDI